MSDPMMPKQRWQPDPEIRTLLSLMYELLEEIRNLIAELRQERES